MVGSGRGENCRVYSRLVITRRTVVAVNSLERIVPSRTFSDRSNNIRARIVRDFAYFSGLAGYRFSSTKCDSVIYDSYCSGSAIRCFVCRSHDQLGKVARLGYFQGVFRLLAYTVVPLIVFLNCVFADLLMSRVKHILLHHLIQTDPL